MVFRVDLFSYPLSLHKNREQHAFVLLTVFIFSFCVINLSWLRQTHPAWQ